jgi:transcriptional regulator with XRE-family HTH domain
MSMISDKLRQALITTTKSRYQLSRETGLAQSQLSRFAAGTRGLGIDSIEALAKALDFKLILKKVTQKRKKV